MQQGNNMAACVRQDATWLKFSTKGQMDFFITFEVGYISSPKCPLSEAKNNA